MPRWRVRTLLVPTILLFSTILQVVPALHVYAPGSPAAWKGGKKAGTAAATFNAPPSSAGGLAMSLRLLDSKMESSMFEIELGLLLSDPFYYNLVEGAHTMFGQALARHGPSTPSPGPQAKGSTFTMPPSEPDANRRLLQLPHAGEITCGEDGTNLHPNEIPRNCTRVLGYGRRRSSLLIVQSSRRSFSSI